MKGSIGNLKKLGGMNVWSNNAVVKRSGPIACRISDKQMTSTPPGAKLQK
jgi:hypothetical protein